MALPTVHIRKEAFLVMIWAAIETFKKECLGFLLGYPPTAENNFYFVTDAVPFQKVQRRSNSKVNLSVRADNAFKKFISDIGGVYPKYLGDFHSHPEWGDFHPSVDMSGEDLIEFAKTPEPLEFIIGVSTRKKGKAIWESLPDGSIKGSFGKFNLHFNVFTLQKGIVPQKLRIITLRSIETLNRVLVKK